MSLGAKPPKNGLGLGGLAALDGVEWERKKKEPSTIWLQRPIVILRRTRNYTVARHAPLCGKPYLEVHG